MRGDQAYGTAPHSAILYAGIEFTNAGKMKESFVKHLQHILEVFLQCLSHTNTILKKVVENAKS